MDDVRLRAATYDDMAAVAAVYRHWVHTSTVTFDEVAPDGEQWARRLDGIERSGLPFLVAQRCGADGDSDGDGKSDGDILGYAYCAPWRAKPAYRHCAEDSIYLAPGAAGAGIGTALLRLLLTRAGQAGVREVVAVIADSGHPASLRLHRRCGFRTVGRLEAVGRKHGRWIDTVLMQRSLRGPV